MKVLLDTNFLVYLIKNKKFNDFLDFLDKNFGKYEIYIFETSLAEIGNISRKVLKNVKLLINKKIINVIPKKGKIDKLILENKDNFIVATLDKELAKKIEKKIIKRGNYFQFL
jgi:rRNA-processing protein FCF1